MGAGKPARTRKGYYHCIPCTLSTYFAWGVVENLVWHFLLLFVLLLNNTIDIIIIFVKSLARVLQWYVLCVEDRVTAIYTLTDIKTPSTKNLSLKPCVLMQDSCTARKFFCKCYLVTFLRLCVFEALYAMRCDLSSIVNLIRFLYQLLKMLVLFLQFI